MRRVVITGMGIASCIGNDCLEALESLQQGRSGIEFISERKSLGFRSAIGGRIRGLPVPDIPKRNLRQMGRGAIFAVHATKQALASAGLAPEEIRHERAGFVMGNVGNVEDTYRQCRAFHDKTERLGAAAMQRVIADSVSANLSVLFGTKGYCVTLSAACATGAAAIGYGVQLIRLGLQDVCVCGGTQEDGWEVVCHFDALQALSLREAEPTKASRPFDRHRDGLVPSAGCGVVVLEELERAQLRGARIYAEVVGYALNSDGYDMTVPSGDGSVRCMMLALKDAGVTSNEVDYINAHATSTPVGDVVEAQSIAHLFGRRPYVSSTKSMTGHELGAAGSNEIIYTLLMMQHGFVAPTINLDDLDPKCDGISIVAKEALELDITVAMSNSFGFGGVNTCLVLKTFRPL